MDKIKNIMVEHKIFFTIFFLAIALLGIEYVAVNNYVDKKTGPTSNKVSNRVSNINDLPEKQKKIIGIGNSNTNTSSNNSNEVETESITKTVIEDKKEKKKEELSNKNTNPDYIEYEKKSEEEKQKIEVIPSKEKVDIDKLNDLEKNNTSEYPTKFDLSEIIKFNVQQQNPYGLCWDFASTKVFESYLALKDGSEHNFSEITVDYITSNLLYNYRSLHDGGYFFVYNKAVQRLGGLIEEKDVEQEYTHDFTFSEYTNFFNLPRTKIDGYEVVHFPTIYYNQESDELKDTDGNIVNEETKEEYRNAIKNHLMENSALYVSMFYFDNPDHKNYVKNKEDLPEGEYADIESANCFYCKGESCSQAGPHAMVIVGWDDNFDRRVFRKVDSNTGELKYMPEKNGAFILLDSQQDTKTLFYMSYEYPYLYQDLNGIKTFDVTKGYNLNKLSNKKLRDYFINQYEEKLIYVDNDIYIPYSDLEEIYSIVLKDMDLLDSDLEIFKYMKEVSYFEMDNVNVSNINFLSVFDKLDTITINNSNISDISVLSNLPKLTTIDLSNNNISDISPLSTLYDLMVITLDNNPLTNYESSLSNLTNLNILSMENCGITNLTLNSNNNYNLINLSGNPNLNLNNKIKVKILELNNNNLTNLDILNKVEENELSGLIISNNDIKDISPLSKYKNLKSLDLSSNKNIEKLDVLKEIYKETKNKTYNVSTSLFNGALNSIIKKYTEDHIEINSNETEEPTEEEAYDSTGMAFGSIENVLIMNDCNISDITIFNNLDINKLELSNNNITSVEKFNNDNVISLDISNNKIENVDNLFNNKINELYLSNNSIKNINIKNKINFMEVLDLSNNDITDISSLNKIDSIYTLSLANNPNFSNYNYEKEAYYLNLSNTSIDDGIIDKLNYEFLYAFAISGNENITNIENFISKLNSKVEIENDNLNNKYNPYDNNINYKKNDYIYLTLVVNEKSLTKTLISDKIDIYANYDLALNKDINGNINLLDELYYPLFRLSFKDKLNYHNLIQNRDKTKLNIINPNDSSYINYNYYSVENGFNIKFN